MIIITAILLIVVAGAFGLSQLIGPSRTTASPSPAQPAWLGVQMGVLPAGAVVLTGVDSGGPAARAGLHTGDVITQIEGRPVAAPVDVTEAVAALRVGDTVEIQALRGSHPLTVRPRLTAQGAGSP